MGKIYQEGQGEVQEMIDICDFAVGLSRQLYGLTMHSERPGHRMYEQYHPLGIVGVVSAFNFPVAVWSWNAMIALVCGDVLFWKPSSKVLLCAIAVHQIIAGVLKENHVPEGVLNLVATSSKYLGDDLFADRELPLISFTGSTQNWQTGRQAGRGTAGQDHPGTGRKQCHHCYTRCQYGTGFTCRCIWCSRYNRATLYFYPADHSA